MNQILVCFMYKIRRKHNIYDSKYYNSLNFEIDPSQFKAHKYE